MGTTDNNGIWKYDLSDSVNGWPAYMNLGMNSISNALTVIRQNTLYKASSLADANTKVAGLKASGLTPSAANPFVFTRSDTNSLWSYNNSAWTELGPTNPVTSTSAKQLIQTGTWSYGSPIAPGGQTGDRSITFSKAYASAPKVLVSSSTARIGVDAKEITTTGFKSNGYNVTNGASGNGVVCTWIAIGTAA